MERTGGWGYDDHHADYLSQTRPQQSQASPPTDSRVQPQSQSQLQPQPQQRRQNRSRGRSGHRSRGRDGLAPAPTSATDNPPIESISNDSATTNNSEAVRPITSSALPATRVSEEDNSSLAPGEPVPFLCRRHTGYITSLVLASMLSAILKRGLLPLMQNELGLELYQKEAAELLLMLPWSCSFVFGLFSDAMPIAGSRWRSYMELGWVTTATALLAMGFYHHSVDWDTLVAEDKPGVISVYLFWLGCACFGGIMSVVVAEIYVIVQEQRYLRSERGQFLADFLLTQFGAECVGQVVTDFFIFRISDDEMQPIVSFRVLVLLLAFYCLVPIVALAFFFQPAYDVEVPSQQQKHEKEHDALGQSRGLHGEMHVSDQDAAFVSARSSKSLAILETETSKRERDSRQAMLESQGWSVEGQPSQRRPPVLEQGPHAPLTWLDRVQQWLLPLWIHAQALWATLMKQSSWYVVVCLSCYVFFSEFSLKYPLVKLEQWYGVTSKSESSSKILADAVYCFTVFIWKVAFMNTSWRKLFAVSLVSVVIVPELGFFLLAALGSARSLGLYAIVWSIRTFVRSLLVIIQVAMAVEIAPMGHEGALLSAIISITSIMRLVSTTFSNSIGYVFGTQVLLSMRAATQRALTSVSKQDGSASESMASDQAAFVVTALMLCYGIKLLALSGLVCAPAQKQQLQRLVRTGPESKNYPVLILVQLVVSLIICIVVNSSIVTPDMTCDRELYGGTGC